MYLKRQCVGSTKYCLCSTPLHGPNFQCLQQVGNCFPNIKMAAEIQISIPALDNNKSEYCSTKVRIKWFCCLCFNIYI